MQRPLVVELNPVPPVADALAALGDWPSPLLLDSARQNGPTGRYSFLTADPLEEWALRNCEYGADPFGEIRTRMAGIPAEAVPELPPFQGGVAGLLGYELGGCRERIPPPLWNEFGIPVLVVGLYDWVLAWDHRSSRAWIVAHGLDRSAADRIETVRAALGASRAALASDASTLTPRTPRHPVPDAVGVESNFSRGAYLDAVRRVIDYIEAGDVFQVNLSQRLLARTVQPAVELYRQLRVCNPAPFAGFYARDDWAVLSASPERFVRVDGRIVETSPIKGTRRRRPVPEADLFSRDELRESRKDHAENVMIVDLLRNDLSRVCVAGSISVPRLCAVETCETVQHLVSDVRGELQRERDFWDVMAAAFPGGSITGAPKVRAMEIIVELEQVARGPYCGSLFYVGFDGRADSNILIRTFVQRGGWLQCSVGGGITAASDPHAEYTETLDKAAGMLRALNGPPTAALRPAQQ
jgi:para-aminobenzoate synthetase component 1